jgi:antitoxin (DNA-binding transcriptional repressor) of toxin-antitoxin stability system
MGRIWKSWKPDLVADATVAPHRMLWSGALNHSGEPAKDLDACDDWRECKANFSYREGETIMITRSGAAVKALVIAAFIRRNHFGDRCEAYKIVVETKSGYWSKLWEITHPGFIQRGYLAAGLAPDLEGKGI